MIASDMRHPYADCSLGSAPTNGATSEPDHLEWSGE
jgi:hypothetical protein